MSELLKDADGALALPKNATYIERLKYELCKRIIAYVRIHRMTQTELSIKLGVDPARISEIVHYKIQKYTVDTLLAYNHFLDPQFEVKFKPAI